MSRCEECSPGDGQRSGRSTGRGSTTIDKTGYNLCSESLHPLKRNIKLIINSRPFASEGPGSFQLGRGAQCSGTFPWHHLLRSSFSRL